MVQPLALGGDPLRRRHAAGATGPHGVDLELPGLELQLEIGGFVEAPRLEEAVLHEPDQVLDRALLLCTTCRGRWATGEAGHAIGIGGRLSRSAQAAANVLLLWEHRDARHRDAVTRLRPHQVDARGRRLPRQVQAPPV